MPVFVSASPVVQVLHNNFVSAEKFRHLQAVAKRQGVDVRHLNVEAASSQALSAAVAGAALTVLDVPRPGDRSMVEQRLDQALQQQKSLNTIRLTVGGDGPSGKAWRRPWVAYWPSSMQRVVKRITDVFCAGQVNS